MRSAATEGHLRVWLPTDVEGERRIEDLLVAVRRPQHRHHPLALRDVLAVHLDVDFRGARPVRDRCRPPQHLLDGAGPQRFLLAVALDLLGVRHERLQPDGQRILGGVAAGKRQHKEEELEFVRWQAEVLAVFAGDHRGRQRAPDIVGGVASFLRGEFHRVPEDVGVEVGFVLSAQLYLR
jgi:hypothetical protein